MLRSLGLYATCLRRGFRMCVYVLFLQQRVNGYASSLLLTPSWRALSFELTQQSRSGGRGFCRALLIHSCEVQLWACPELDRRRCWFMSIASLPFVFLNPTIVRLLLLCK